MNRTDVALFALRIGGSLAALTVTAIPRFPDDTKRWLFRAAMVGIILAAIWSPP